MRRRKKCIACEGTGTINVSQHGWDSSPRICPESYCGGKGYVLVESVKLPAVADIRRNVRCGLAAHVANELDNGSEYLFDLVDWGELTPKQREKYQRAVEVEIERIRRWLLKETK